MRWDPLDDPTRVLQQSRVRVTDAYDLTDKTGRHVTLDELGKIAFLGPDEPLPEYITTAEAGERYVTYFRCEYKDPKTKAWKYAEWVRGDGEPRDDWQSLREGDIPFGRSSYFFTPSGDERKLETNPHLRYRPRMTPLYLLVDQWNHEITYLVAFIQMITTLGVVYVKLPPNASSDAVSAFEEMGWIEGAGAQRRLVFRRSAPGSNEWMIAPELAKIPLEVPDAEIIRLQMLKEDIKDHMPNRFLTGMAFKETAEGTGTALIDQRQAAALPFGADLRSRDNTIRDMGYAELACIRTWDKDVPEKSLKPYRVVTTGQEPDARGDPDPGKEVVITAETARRRFVLGVMTKGVTASERYQEQAAAYADYERRTITFEQLLKRLDHPDTKKQQNELDKELIREITEPAYEQIVKASFFVAFSSLGDIDLSIIAPELLGSGGASAQPAQRNGGSNGAAPNNGPVQRPAITPAPVEGPQGGSGAGMAGMVGS